MEMTANKEKPGKHLPLIDEDSRPFWESVAERRMRIPCCTSCGLHRFPPYGHCPTCLSDATEWVEVSGRGKVYVSLTFHRPFHPAWAGDVPYNLSIIELEEGVRMWSNVIDLPPEAVKIGMEVELVYREREDGFVLPVFRPLAG